MTNPKLYTTEAVVHASGKITFLIVCPLTDNHVAVPAIVQATSTKLELNINVRRAPLASTEALAMQRRLGDIRIREYRDLHEAVSKGWTAALLDTAIARYKEIYRRHPDCMVGVFVGDNLKMFLDAFRSRYPNTALSELPGPARVAAARECITKTSFWPPRAALGYTRLMFESTSLAAERVLVRAFRRDLTKPEIIEVADTQKIYPGVAKNPNWMLTDPDS